MVGSRPDSEQPHGGVDRQEHGRFCDEVVNQTGLLVVTLEGADLSANVPTTPDWDLSDLVRHIGGNLRSLETAVRTGEAVTDPGRQIPGHGGPPGDDPAALFAWLSEAAGRCAATLRAAGPEVEAQLWTVRWPTAAWARRAAHDLLIHRADAAGTVGAATCRPGPGRRRPRRVPRAVQQPPGRRGRPGRGGRRPRSQRDHPSPRHRHRHQL